MASNHGKPIYITELGALSGTVCTKVIQRALDVAGDCGVTVVIPPGTYTTGTLHLRSRVTLEIMPGATLLGSADIGDYPPRTWGHNRDRQPHHLLVLDRAHNVTIRGGGTIDGLGPAFWCPQTAPRTWIKPKELRVSPLIEAVGCTDLRIEDVAITNSPGWTVHLDQCERAFLSRLHIRNDFFGPNTDGIDINGCADVIVSGCRIDTGGDAVVLKATPDSRPCRRIIVTGCSLRTNCVGLKIGTETAHDVRQVVFSNCVVHDCTRAVALYSYDGGTVEDISVSGIVCDTLNQLGLNRPIQLSLRRRTPDTPRGALRNVTISNVIARTDGRVVLWAEEGSMLENITIRDVRLSYDKVDDPARTAETAPSSQFNHDNLNAKSARAAVVADNVRNLDLAGLAIDWPPDYAGPDFHAVWGRNLRGGMIDAPLAGPSRKGVERIHLEASDIRVRDV
jgi:hypothetical protein